MPYLESDYIRYIFYDLWVLLDIVLCVLVFRKLLVQLYRLLEKTPHLYVWDRKELHGTIHRPLALPLYRNQEYGPGLGLMCSSAPLMYDPDLTSMSIVPLSTFLDSALGFTFALLVSGLL